MSPQRLQTHHQTYASLRISAVLTCFVCTRLWESLTFGGKAFVMQTTNDQEAHITGCVGVDGKDTNMMTAAPLGEQEPGIQLWHTSDRLLQINSQPIAEFANVQPSFWHVNLDLTDSEVEIVHTSFESTSWAAYFSNCEDFRTGSRHQGNAMI